MDHSKPYNELVNELAQAKKLLEERSIRLEEAESTLDAIRTGEIDALVVKQNDSHLLYTLKSADQTYRIFIEQMKEGVITLNTSNHILYCNSAFAVLVDQPLEKIIGQEFCKYVFGAHWNNCELLLKKAWENNSRGELNIVNIHGKEIPVLLSCNRLDLEESLSMSIILTDLSTQKEQQQILEQKNTKLEQAEKLARYLNANLENLVQKRTNELEKTIIEKTAISEELKSNQERLTYILETMAGGVTIMDLQGNITYANPMAQKILGLEQSPPGKGHYHSLAISETIDGGVLNREEHPMHQSMQTGKPVYDAEIGVTHSGKERIYILLNATPVMGSGNNIIGSIGTFSDVTRRRIAIQQKEDFISVASHELKTPITVLKTSIQLLDRLKDDPTHKMLPVLITQANKGLVRLGSLVEDLLDVSRLKEGQLALNRQSFLLEEILQDAFTHLHMDNNKRLVIRGNQSIRLFADANRIEQVLVNFVNNALKYAPESKEIIISSVLINKEVKISVMDQGPGIDKEKQLYLFDRYYRTDYSGVQYSGLGLGLYISAEIIKKHGGLIGVNSEPGKGSEFWFTLPLNLSQQTDQVKS